MASKAILCLVGGTQTSSLSCGDPELVRRFSTADVPAWRGVDNGWWVLVHHHGSAVSHSIAQPSAVRAFGEAPNWVE
jgi:hypothetical protein